MNKSYFLDLPTDISELHALILELRTLVLAQQEQIVSLQSEVKDLKAQLASTSENSHRPPSSDGYRKKARLPKSKKVRGGQKGHKGSTLKMVSEADHYVDLYAKRCCCGQDLSKVQHQALHYRQVFDLPTPKLEVTQYQLYSCQCPRCGTGCRGEFPEDVSAPVQYGTGVKSLAVLLSNGYNLSYEKIGQLFEDLYGYRPNANTLCQATQKAYRALSQSEAVIQQSLCDQELVHADESGLRIGGKLQWVHGLCTDQLTYLFVHPKRGKGALQSEQSLLPKLTGWLVHDCWASYFAFTQLKHALCGAHILRELQALIDKDSNWAQQMHKFLLDLYKKTAQGTQHIAQTKAIEKRLQRILYQANLEEPPPIPRKRGRPKKTKGRNLFERIAKYKEAALAFAFHQEVPFTNNQAERDIRPIKLKQKMAGSFRTFQGAEQYARIQGFIATARKNQKNTFKELKNAFNGYTFLTQVEKT